MAINSLPKPTTSIPWPTVHPRPLKPIEQCPLPSQIPTLPSPPRQCSFDSLYTLSTHIIPCAHPRSSPDVPLPAPPRNWNNDKAARKTYTGELMAWLLDIKKRHTEGQMDEEDASRKVFWNCLNRYVRKGLENENRKGVTLFFAHANGFPKEIWEPTLHHLVYSNSVSSTGPYIDEIWTWEAIQHGDAALLNAENLSGLFDWRDNARDILNFLLHYLPPTTAPPAGSLPTLLPRVPSHVSESRKHNGYENGRTLVAVGHSLGGCTSALAALEYPALFSSIMLVDPVILPVGSYNFEHLHAYITGAVQRRDSWPSREEALRLFSANPFFAAWDREVLKVYIECGLYENGGGEVKLKMPGVQEAVLFADTTVAYEVFEELEKLDERVELRWVLPGNARKFELGGDEVRPYRAWRRPANASNVIIPGAGHLIAQEAPKALAEEIQHFLAGKYGSQGEEWSGKARL